MATRSVNHKSLYFSRIQEVQLKLTCVYINNAITTGCEFSAHNIDSVY